MLFGLEGLIYPTVILWDSFFTALFGGTVEESSSNEAMSLCGEINIKLMRHHELSSVDRNNA